MLTFHLVFDAQEHMTHNWSNLSICIIFFSLYLSCVHVEYTKERSFLFKFSILRTNLLSFFFTLKIQKKIQMYICSFMLFGCQCGLTLTDEYSEGIGPNSICIMLYWQITVMPRQLEGNLAKILVLLLFIL